jgi:hypothetical protein
MTVDEAMRLLTAAQDPPPTPGRRRRRRGQPIATEGSPEEEEEFETVGSFQPAHWQNLMLKSRQHWARYFCFADEDAVNMIVKDGMGEDILAPENSMVYDLAFSKVRTWGRQWQCETLKRFVSHVKQVYDADKETLSELTASGVRNHFYRGLNEQTVKYVFHVLNPDIDLSEVLNSAACSLYCTLFTNMCAYILEHRVKVVDRTATADELIFRNFKDCAMEDVFKNVTPDDIPLRPRKPTGAKRQRREKLPPLSKRDDAFRVYGPPPGITPRQPKAVVELEQQEASEATGN